MSSRNDYPNYPQFHSFRSKSLGSSTRQNSLEREQVVSPNSFTRGIPMYPKVPTPFFTSLDKAP